MPKTSFLARIHGFHFSNNDIPWSFGMMHGENLCGGMSFASLDFYYYRMQIPSMRQPPPEGTPLHNYILRRQMQAHTFAIPRLITGDRGWRADPFAASLRADQYFGVLKRSIDAGRPLPILLAARGNTLSTNSHWVVATGYEMLSASTYGCAICQKLYVYDNNHPDVESELAVDMLGRTFRLQRSARQYSRRLYSYYAPFEQFTTERPTPQAMHQRPSTTNLATNPFRLPRVGF